MSEHINGTALPIHGWEMSGPEIPWICPKYKHTEKHRSVQRSPTCSDLSSQNFWCCVLFKKGPPSKDLWAAGMVLPHCVTADTEQISQPCQPALQHTACGVTGQAVPGCHKGKGSPSPSVVGPMQQGQTFNARLRKVMTIHAVADPHGIFPFSCNIFPASIVTQNWKQGAKPLVASSGLRCLLLMYIHVIDKNIDTYIHNYCRFLGIHFLHCITAIKQKDECDQGVNLKKSHKAPTNTKMLEQRKSNATQIFESQQSQQPFQSESIHPGRCSPFSFPPLVQLFISLSSGVLFNI